MGAGGKEMVFQCNSEWMANFYAKHAPYPNANVSCFNQQYSHLNRSLRTSYLVISYGEQLRLIFAHSFPMVANFLTH